MYSWSPYIFLIDHVRPEVDSLKRKLYDKGATHVLTYDDIADKAIKERVNNWTGGKVCDIALIPMFHVR
jgi:hypothetical protein